jgi:hypothetical protein
VRVDRLYVLDLTDSSVRARSRALRGRPGRRRLREDPGGGSQRRGRWLRRPPRAVGCTAGAPNARRFRGGSRCGYGGVLRSAAASAAPCGPTALHPTASRYAHCCARLPRQPRCGRQRRHPTPTLTCLLANPTTRPALASAPTPRPLEASQAFYVSSRNSNLDATAREFHGWCLIHHDGKCGLDSEYWRHQSDPAPSAASRGWALRTTAVQRAVLRRPVRAGSPRLTPSLLARMVRHRRDTTPTSEPPANVRTGENLRGWVPPQACHAA